MRHYHAVLILCLLAIAGEIGAATYDRKIQRTVDLSSVPDAEVLSFHRQESVTLDLTVLRDGAAVVLTNESFSSHWTILPRTSAVDVVESKAGVVTSGVLRFTLTPEESGLTNGVYDGWIVMQEGEGRDMTAYSILHRQSIEVRATP